MEQKLSAVTIETISKILKESDIKGLLINNTLIIHDILEIKERILDRLVLADYSIIDLILDEYDASTHGYQDFDMKIEYIKFRISRLDENNHISILEYLDRRRALNFEPDFWGHNKLKVFISYLSKVKLKAINLSNQIKRYNISSFVAHEDIELNEEWLIKIEQAPISMDVLVALVTDGFKDSNWTAQKVGFALGREYLFYQSETVWILLAFLVKNKQFLLQERNPL